MECPICKKQTLIKVGETYLCTNDAVCGYSIPIADTDEPPCIDLQPIECEKHRGCFECGHYNKIGINAEGKQKTAM